MGKWVCKEYVSSGHYIGRGKKMQLRGGADGSPFTLEPEWGRRRDRREGIKKVNALFILFLFEFFLIRIALLLLLF